MTAWSLYELAGFAGVAVYLGSYAALQLGKLHGQGYAYAGLNMLAATLVLVSLVNAFNLSSAIIQASWITISAVGITRYYILKHFARFSEEESAFLAKALPDLDSVKARKLLDLGEWVTGEPNTVLTEADIPVPYLIYLTEGGADVLIQGSVVAAIGGGTFIGEITALSGEPATATVILNEQSRYLAIPAAGLRDLLARDRELRLQLENCFSSEVKRKLIRQSHLQHSEITEISETADPERPAADAERVTV